MNTPIFDHLCKTHGDPLKPSGGSIRIVSGAITADKINTGDMVVVWSGTLLQSAPSTMWHTSHLYGLCSQTVFR